MHVPGYDMMDSGPPSGSLWRRSCGCDASTGSRDSKSRSLHKRTQANNHGLRSTRRAGRPHRCDTTAHGTPRGDLVDMASQHRGRMSVCDLLTLASAPASSHDRTEQMSLYGDTLAASDSQGDRASLQGSTKVYEAVYSHLSQTLGSGTLAPLQ